jgi:hypothetical protein
MSSDLYLVFAWKGRPAGGADDLMGVFESKKDADEFLATVGKAILQYQIVRLETAQNLSTGTFGYRTIEEVV